MGRFRFDTNIVSAFYDEDISSLIRDGYSITFKSFGTFNNNFVEIYAEKYVKGKFYTIVGAGVNVEEAWMALKHSIFEFERTFKINRKHLKVIK